MNERIKELMFEAFQSHYGDPITTGAREKAVDLVSGWGEKFAELIVRECAKICDEEALDERDDFAMRRIEHCSWMIKEHFGVEE